MGSSPKPPKTPDYRGAAEETAEGNYRNLEYQTYANRPDQYTPFGSSVWDTSNGKDWTQTITLDPQVQEALDAQMAIQRNNSQLAQTLQGQVAERMAGGPNLPDYAQSMSGVPGVDMGYQDFNSTAPGFNYGYSGFNGYTPRQITGVNQFRSSAPGYDYGYTGFNASGQPQQLTGYTPFSSTAPGLSTDFKDFNASGAGSIDSTRIDPNTGNILGVNQTFSSGANVNTNAPQWNQQYADDAAKAYVDDNMALRQEDWDRESKRLDEKLRLQGLTPGTEAYDNAMNPLLKQQSAEKQSIARQGVLTGTDIASQKYSNELAGFRAGNEAVGQQFGQDSTSFGMTNDARSQALSNELNTTMARLQSQGASNAAQDQAYRQILASYGVDQSTWEKENEARQQQFGRDTTAYGANLDGMNASNAARDTQFQQALQGYATGQQALASRNALVGQQFSQDLAGFGANQSAINDANAARDTQFNQSLQRYQTGQDAITNQNQTANQAFARDLANFGANNTAVDNRNQAQQQSYMQALQNYGNEYNAAIGDYYGPLNAMNAVLSGQQVQSPQMPNYTQAGYVPGADYAGATKSQAAWDQGIYNVNAAQADQQNGMISQGIGAAIALIAMY